LFKHKIEKAISIEKDSYASIYQKLQLQNCNNILKFCNSKGWDVNTIIKYKDLLAKHIEILELGFKELDSIINKIFIIESNSICEPFIQINNQKIHVRCLEEPKSFEFLYPISFDPYDEMYVYGYFELNSLKKSWIITEKQLAFSHDCSLTEVFRDIDYLNYFLNGFNSVKNLEELNKIKRELFTALKIEEWTDVYDNKYLENNFSDIIHEIGRALRNNKVRLELEGKGFIDTTIDLIELIQNEIRLRAYKNIRTEEIEVYGEDQYNAILNRIALKNSELRQKCKISNNELNNLINALED